MSQQALLFDTHAHLDFDDLYEDLDGVVARAEEAGVQRIVTIGASRGLESNRKALSIARSYDQIHCTAGIHPHEADQCDDQIFATIADEFASLPEVVAIGETGLDYYYDNAPKKTQHEVFRRFLRLARDVDKPVVIHSRDADDDTVRILREEGNTKGILHCFTGSAQMAEAVVELGFHISFSGIATFNSAGDLRDIAAAVPDDRILIETDSPFLAPSPHRGSTNEPAYVAHTAKVLAQVRDQPFEQFARLTFENGCRLYDLDS